jgi:drug/metabolite transporter (DMT)-like permease
MMVAAYVALIVSIVVWAASFIATKVVLDSFDTHQQVFIRLAMVAVVLLPLVLRKRAYQNYQKGDALRLAFMSLCLPVVYFVLEIEALSRITAAQGGMIAAVEPLLIGVLAAVVLKESMPWRAWLGLAVCTVGVVWMTLSGHADIAANAPSAAENRLGIILEVLAMVCAAGYTLMVRTLSQRYSIWVLVGLQSVIGTIAYTPVIWLTDMSIILDASVVAWAWMVFLGFGVSLGGYALYGYALTHIQASRVAPWLNLIPVVAAILGWLLLNEVLTLYQYLAGALVLAGVMLAPKEEESPATTSVTPQTEEATHAPCASLAGAVAADLTHVELHAVDSTPSEDYMGQDVIPER